MDLLKTVFNLNITKEFVAIGNAIALQNPKFINNGIGVNFSENSIESIKIYYGFHHRFKKEDVEKLHLFGKSDTFYQLASLLTNDDYIWHDFLPTGVSFALKIDRNLNVSMGHFLMPKLTKEDVFFSLPKVKEYYKSNNQLPVFGRKGIFTLIGKDGIENHKNYYYVNNSQLKDIINKDFNVDINIAPSVEWAIGKGFYANSSVDDEKIVLQSNYNKVYHTIIKKEDWVVVKEFNKKMLEMGIYCVCPGYYKNKLIKSYYYFHVNKDLPNIINTIPELVNGVK